jgi:transcriptional regulator with XRE-family HTH domain
VARGGAVVGERKSLLYVGYGLLREARAIHKSSLRTVAQKAGMAHTQLLAIENSNGKVELKTLARIADALECELRVAFVPRANLKQVIETRV